MPRDWDEEDEYDDRPRRRYRDDDDRDPDDEEEDDRSDRWEEARRRTVGPAIGLIVAAVLGLIGNLGWTALNFAAPKQPPPANMPANQRQGYEVGYVMGAACPGTLGLVFGLLMTLGAVGLMKGNRGLALTGIIIGFLPCQAGWLLSLPFGIWGMVVLNDPDVSRAFRR